MNKILKPTGNKVLIEVRRNDTKKIGNTEIKIIQEGDMLVELFVKDKGPNCVDDGIKIGDEIMLTGHSASFKWDRFKDQCVVPESDIWVKVVEA